MPRILAHMSSRAPKQRAKCTLFLDSCPVEDRRCLYKNKGWFFFGWDVVSGCGGACKKHRCNRKIPPKIAKRLSRKARPPQSIPHPRIYQARRNMLNRPMLGHLRAVGLHRSAIFCLGLSAFFNHRLPAPPPSASEPVPTIAAFSHRPDAVIGLFTRRADAAIGLFSSRPSAVSSFAEQARTANAFWGCQSRTRSPSQEQSQACDGGG